MRVQAHDASPTANYLLIYGSTPGVAALKAPQDNSPGQRPIGANFRLVATRKLA